MDDRGQSNILNVYQSLSNLGTLNPKHKSCLNILPRVILKYFTQCYIEILKNS